MLNDNSRIMDEGMLNGITGGTNENVDNTGGDGTGGSNPQNPGGFVPGYLPTLPMTELEK